MNNKQKLFLTKYAAGQINPMDPALSKGFQVDRGPQQELGPVNFNSPQQLTGANGKPMQFDEDTPMGLDPQTFNAPFQSQIAAKGTPHEAWQQSGGSFDFPASSIGVSPRAQQQEQMAHNNKANTGNVLPGRPITASEPGDSETHWNGGYGSGTNGTATTPLNGLPGYAIGANRPSQQYDSAGTPEGFPGYSPNPASDPFKSKPVGPAAGGAQPVLPPPPGGVQGLGSMSGRTLPIPR